MGKADRMLVEEIATEVAQRLASDRVVFELPAGLEPEQEKAREAHKDAMQALYSTWLTLTTTLFGYGFPAGPLREGIEWAENTRDAIREVIEERVPA